MTPLADITAAELTAYSVAMEGGADLRTLSSGELLGRGFLSLAEDIHAFLEPEADN